MKNITKGFKNKGNIRVIRASVIDGARFMITTDGIDICDASASKYFVPFEGATFEYEITEQDKNVPPLTETDRMDIKDYILYYGNMSDAVSPQWVKAAKRL